MGEEGFEEEGVDGGAAGGGGGLGGAEGEEEDVEGVGGAEEGDGEVYCGGVGWLTVVEREDWLVGF